MAQIDDLELAGQNIHPCTECGTYICCYCQNRTCTSCKKPLCDLCLLDLRKYRDQCTECASTWSLEARSKGQPNDSSDPPPYNHFGVPRRWS